MLHHLKSLSKDSFAYSISNIITRASSFILLPIYARLFAPADIGVINLINVTYFFVSSVSLFCLDSAAVVFYWKDEIREKQRIFSSWFWFVFVVNALIFLLVFLFSGSISTMVFETDRYAEYFTLMFLTGVCNTLPFLYSNNLRIRRQPFAQLKISALAASLTLGFTLYFLFYLDSGVIGIFYSQLAAAIVNAAICYILFRKNLSFSFFDAPLLKKMLKFSIPIIPTTITFWVSNSVSLYAINYYYSEHQVGIYNVANSIASVISIVVSATSQAVLPFALSIQKEPGAPKVYSNVLKSYFMIVGFIALVVAVFSREVLMLIATSKFLEGELALIILAFNAVLLGAMTIAGIGLNIAQRMKSLLYVSLACTALNLALIFVLVPPVGKEGAAIATLLSSLLLVVLVMRSSQKAHFIPYSYTVPVLSFTLYFSSALALFYAGGLNSMMLMIKILFCIGVFVASFLYVRKIFRLG